jgi:hypothetical protein
MPTADDLFRPTRADPEEDTGTGEGGSGQPGKLAQTSAAPGQPGQRLIAAPDPVEEPSAGRRTSGRVRHDEKMTVYVTADELIELEHARLSLRREHGLAVDRGRLVREAIAIALAELDETGEESALVQRLTAS